MNLRLVSKLSETLLLTFSRWLNERSPVPNSQRTILVLGRDARDLPIRLEPGGAGSLSTILLG